MSGVVLAAEYTKRGKGALNLLTINRIEAGRRSKVCHIVVAGKVEARQVAKEHGAQPWNF